MRKSEGNTYTAIKNPRDGSKPNIGESGHKSKSLCASDLLCPGNDFLNTKFSTIPLPIGYGKYDEIIYVEDNYQHLLKTAQNYCKLLGVELKLGEGDIVYRMLQLVKNFEKIIKDTGFELNVVHNKNLSYFMLYKNSSEWPDYSFFHIPVGIADRVSDKLRLLLIEFFSWLKKSQKLDDVLEMFEMYGTIDYFIQEHSGHDNYVACALKYKKWGVAYRLFKHIDNCRYRPKTLGDRLLKYKPISMLEHDLVFSVLEGIDLLNEGKCIMSNAINTDYEGDIECYYPEHVVELGEIVRFIYDMDLMTENYQESVNCDLDNSSCEEVGTVRIIDPSCKKLVTYDDYPGKFSKWCIDIMTIIIEEYEQNSK